PMPESGGIVSLRRRCSRVRNLAGAPLRFIRNGGLSIVSRLFSKGRGLGQARFTTFRDPFQILTDEE
ncbi:MAG: hypothetical protein ABIP13_08605, partial [Tepidiformaceae bacterium]